MVRSHPCYRFAPAGVLAVALVVTLSGRAAAAEGEKPPAVKGDDVALTVSAAAEPVPALKYRLFPRESDRKPGDAAPIYLRFAHERTDKTKRDLVEKVSKWNETPLDKLPRDDVKAFLRLHASDLKELDLGARRQARTWHYRTDAGDPFHTPLG